MDLEILKILAETYQKVTMRKTTSTNYENEIHLKDECAMIFAIGLISGRWKPLIYWKLMEKRVRLSELKKMIPKISERMLISQLKQLEKDKLVKRIVYKEVPPRVEYELTKLGQSLKPMLMDLSVWGTKNYKRIEASEN